MSRVASNPVVIPSGVEIKIAGNLVHFKGKKGELSQQLSHLVELKQTDVDGKVAYQFVPKSKSREANAMAGTSRAIFNNAVLGVNQGFEKKLLLEGVGYRAQAKGQVLGLTLGFSHPVDYKLPAGVSVETPTQTEVVLKSSNKQVLGQTAAEIRKIRAPEPYKGKGVRYQDEQIRRKETKKK